MGERASIALCTYNGERYLGDQLGSFVSQSRRPDELIVCDDGSTDRTIEILRQFAASAPFPVHIHQNERNLGVQANFAKAISLCRSEIVFLSDQDDVWHDEKIEQVMRAFAGRPDAGLVVTNAEVVDENLKSLGYLHWDGLDFDARYRQRIATGQAFAALIQHCPLSGATMALRSRYSSLVCPIPGGGWTHDWWIARLIAAVAPVLLIEHPLSKYRQHSSQTIGGERRSIWSFARSKPDVSYYQKELDQYGKMRERLRSTPGVQPPGQILDLLDEKISLCEARLAIRQTPLKRPFIAIGQLLRGRYHRCARGWITFGRDLLR